MMSSPMKLDATDFELFGVPERFAQDRAALDTRWKALQREAHPDRFAAQGGAAQRLAMQWSVRINEAYQRLKDPLQARGLSVRAARRAASTPRTTRRCRRSSWCSRWSGARRWTRPRAAGRRRACEVQAGARAGAGAHRAADRRRARLPAAAAQQVRALMFIERFAHDIEVRAEQLGTIAAMALLQISEPGQAPDPHQRRIAVGIDLGTTHSLVAAVRNGVAECLPDSEGRVLLPSAVRYLDAQRRQIGFDALAAQAQDAANTIASVKRLMGRGLADIVHRDKHAVPASPAKPRHGARCRRRRARSRRWKSAPRSWRRCASAPRTASTTTCTARSSPCRRTSTRRSARPPRTPRSWPASTCCA